MAPISLTADPGTTPGSAAGAIAGRTDRTPTFEPGEFGEGDERTVVNTAAAYELRPRFTGRGGTLARLEEVVRRAANEQQLGFAVIVGDPGMGKSRMIAELAARIREEQPEALILAGVAEENATHGPVNRALIRYFGFVEGEAVAESRDRIQAAIAETQPAARVPELAHLFAHLLRVPFEDSPVVTPLLESPQRLEARIFMAVRRLVAAIADQRPVVLIVENLEHCGSDTINVLHYLAAGLRRARLAIIGTATAALFDRHPTFGEGEVAPERIALKEFSAAEAEALLRELCRPLDQVPDRLVAHVRAMGGSPRAIHELVRLLLESDVITREGLVWRIDQARLAAMALPRSNEELVAARLRVMDPTERRVLEMAAVVGEAAWLDSILAVERGGARIGEPDGPTLSQIAASGDHSRLAVVAAIGKLVEREWLYDVADTTMTGERELRFAYPNLRQLVYRGVDDGRRRLYHAVIARWLELHPEGRGPAAQEEVARHLELAGDAREAGVRYRRAAEVARALYANERAIRLFDRALACIGDSDLAARIHVWHDLGSVYELIGDCEAALGAFERMLRLSWVVASKTKAAVAFNKMGRVWRRKGDLKLALEYLERGHELFRAAGDSRGVAGSLDDVGKVLQLLGRYDEAHAKITEALARRGQGGDKRSIAASLSTLGTVQHVRGQYDSALTCHQEALELRRAIGDRWGQAVSHNNLAALAYELGDAAGARSGWLSALSEAEAIGAVPLSAVLLTNLGELALSEGKLEEARSRLEDALELIEDIEDRQLESECCRHLAGLERQLGHASAARELADRALAVARKAGLREQEGQAYLVLGEVLSASLYDAGDAAGAIAPAALAYGRAVEVFQEIGNDALSARALHYFGRYKAECGQLADARDMLRDAITVYTRLGLTRPAAEAQRLLVSLA